MNERAEYGPSFWIGLAAGLPLIGVGVVELVEQAGAHRAVDVARWAIGLNVLHDLLLVPAICLVGFALTRLVPATLRAPIRTGVIVSAALVVVAFPALRGYGRDQVPGNPTVQPLNYATATATALGVVWTVIVLWAIVRVLRTRA